MNRLKAIVEYDGTNYCGWQFQLGQPSIQQALTQAFSSINNSHVTIFSAGRTDAGVHAAGQVIHADVSKDFSTEVWQRAINSQLPPDIRIHSIEICEDLSFHSRYSAKSKTYIYRLWKGQTVSPFWHRYVHSVQTNLDWEAMNEASKSFLGTHDFNSFTVASCEVTSFIRTIYKVEWNNISSDICSIEFKGTGFLRYMVRLMVGTLLEIGRRRVPLNFIENILSGDKKIKAGPKAPAKGLMLLNVDY